MKILYNIHCGIGHFPHMFPYYQKLGGLIYTPKKSVAERLSKEYKGINITTDFDKVKEYDPDIVMYTDYHPKLRELNAKSVMVFHAIELKGYYAAVVNWNWCEYFDLCLLYGKKLLQEFKDNGWIIKYEIIGYPRFDNIFKLAHPIFDNDKKTILVAPTWGDLSLFHKFTDDIIDLTRDYNIIIKAHDMTNIGSTRDNNDDNFQRLRTLQNDSLKVFSNADILPLMNISDMIITDYSGSSCEFMYFNKPIIICDPNRVPIISRKKPDVWKVFKVCENPLKLKDMVDSQFRNDDMKNEREEDFKELIYTEKETTATERGILAMKQLLRGE